MLRIAETPSVQVQRVLCGRLLTMDAPLEGPQVIEIEGDKIKGIRPATPADRGASDTLDLSHLTVLPGLIDAHTHLDFDVLAGNEAAQANVDDATLLLRMVTNAAINLRHGVTAVRLLGSRDFLDITLRRAIDAGQFPGPRIVTATRGIMSSMSFSANNPSLDGKDALRAAIRENIRRGADLIKLFHSGHLGGGEDACAPHFAFDELCAAVEESHRHGRTVTVHAYGGKSVDECIEAGVDCIEHGFLMAPDQYTRAAAKGIQIVPTLGVMTAEPGLAELPHWSDELRAKMLWGRQMSWDSVALLRDSGAMFALATDAVQGGVADEAGYGVRGGLSIDAALRSVTVWAAEISGLAGKAGVVAPGAWADLIAVEGDPLADITKLKNPRIVLKGGCVVAGA